MISPNLNNGTTADTSNTQDGYFAVAQPDRLAGTCLAKAESFYNLLAANRYLDQLSSMWQFYHGQYGDQLGGGSHRIEFGGQEGELVMLPVNHFRNIAQHMLQMITSTRPVMEASAVNTDAKSLAQAYLANGILDYYMKQKHLEDHIRRATELAIVMGSGFIRMEWNATGGELYDFDEETQESAYEGEIEFTTLSPFDVVFDGTKESWNNEWVIVRTFKNKYDLIAKYPEMENKIKGIPTKDQSSTYRLALFSNDSTDDVAVYEFFHRKSEAVPEGRYMLFLAPDCVLLDLPLPYREIPIYRITAGEFLGTPYGYSPMFDIYPIQEGINSLYSTIMTNQSAFGVQNLFVQRGSDLDINSLEGAMNIIEGNSAPQPLQLTATPKEVFDFLQILIQSAETISGVNSVARGDPQSSLKSGTALALVQSMALQFISGLQNNYVKLIEDVGSSLINILKDYSKTPKTVALVGKNNRPLLKEFTGDDINDINRVFVTVGNPLAHTTAGKVQMAEQMLQMGLITTPQQYFQVMTTGDLEDMYQSDMNELFLVKTENEMMMEGKEVLAEMLDEHKLHIQEHRIVMADPDLRQDANLRKIVQDHIQQHINFLRTVDPDLLQLIGQTPLANPQAPQQAPQMSPGGPPPGPPMGPPPPNQGPQGPAPSGPPGPHGNPHKPRTPHIKKGNSIGATLTTPNQPESPQQFLKGQGVAGGGLLPNIPKPPAAFRNLPTNAADLLGK